MSPEFEMVGTGRDTGLQANYDFLQSNDPLMQSVLNSTMIDSISLDGSYLANMPAMTHESGMSYEERNSLDPEAYHFTAEIPKGGDNFNQLYSKFIGVHAVDAAEYYVDQHVKTGNPLWAIPGSLALLATPENAGKTALVLGGAGVASSFMTAYRAAGVLGVAEEGALITAETASGVPLVRRWDFDVQNSTVFNSGGDRLLNTMGSARVNNPAEYNAIIDDLKLNRVDISFREGQFAYGPAPSGGRPGNIVFDPDASLSAIRHEYGHFLDDKALGYPGQRYYYENPSARVSTERSQYLNEIRTSRELNDQAARRQLIEDYLSERQYLIDNYYTKPYGSN
jgi:hypothetical protein